MRLQLLFLFINCFLLMYKVAAFSQVLESPLSYEGGPDAHIFKMDTVMLENAYLDKGPQFYKADTVITGLTFLHSPYLSNLAIPIKYAATTNFSMGISIPYLTKTYVRDSIYYSKGGYGDTQLFLSYADRYTLLNMQFYFKMTLPSGDATARDDTVTVPMGYGSYTFSGLLTFSGKQFELFVPAQFFCNIGGIYYTESIRDVDVSERYTIASTYTLSALVGCQFRLKNRLYLYLKGNIIYIPERKYKYSDLIGGSTGDWTDLNDSLISSDLIATLSYRLLPDANMDLLIIYPIYSDEDEDIVDPKERKWKFCINFEKRFGSAGKRSRRSRRKR